MATIFGLRSYKRIDYTTPNQVVEIDDVSKFGSYVLLEVTNPSSTTDIDFFPNPDLPTEAGGGIPVPKGTTRQIPMTVYRFKATGNCTVIAYKM